MAKKSIERSGRYTVFHPGLYSDKELELIRAASREAAENSPYWDELTEREKETELVKAPIYGILGALVSDGYKWRVFIPDGHELCYHVFKNYEEAAGFAAVQKEARINSLVQVYESAPDTVPYWRTV